MDTAVCHKQEISTATNGVIGEIQKTDNQTHSSLTPKEMDTIRSLDSRSFGFLDLAIKNDSTSVSTTSSTGFMSSDFLRKGINMLRIELLSEHMCKSVESKVLCHIAHLHLLLKEYTEALSAYQHCVLLDSSISSDTTFLYGVGLIYFALAKYTWALEAFQKVLLFKHDFARLNEVHVRIALMLKKEGKLQDSLSHFAAALSHTGPCSITKLEMQFHVGHIHHIQGDYIDAKKRFESILASKNVPNNIKALTLRQLGWLYHTVPHISTRGENPFTKATELLKLAVSANPDSGQAWYFLGRCHADQGQYREAFHAYRQSVMIVEGHADTWCAIGILYQQMGQARDSLQAYITAVYFCPTHVETWTDLGLLYESCDQLIDGYLCYQNGLESLQKRERMKNNKATSFEGVHEILSSRIRFVEHQIQQNGGIGKAISQTSLPSLVEAWSSLVPQHLREKYAPLEMPILQLPPALIMSPGNMTTKHTKLKRTRPSKEPIIMKSMIGDGWNCLSPGKLVNGMNTATDPGNFDPQLMPILSPDFISHQDVPMGFNGTTPMYFDNGTNGHDGMVSPMMCSPQNIITPDPMEGGTSSTDTCSSVPNSSVGDLVPDPCISVPVSFVGTKLQSDTNPCMGNDPLINGNYHVGGTPSEYNDTLPHDLSTVWPLSTHVNMEEYLGTLTTDGNIDSMDAPPCTLQHLPNTKGNIRGKRKRAEDRNTTSKRIADSDAAKSQYHRRTHVHSGHHSDTSSGVSSSHKTSLSDSPTPSPASLCSYDNDSHSSYRKTSTSESDDSVIIPIHEPHPGLGVPGEYMLTKHSTIQPPSPPASVQDIDLHPTVPIYDVTSSSHSMFDELHEFCTNPNLPICIIRGLSEASEFDLSLFETKTLMSQCGDHHVEIREQNLQAANENWDTTGKKQVWKCESSRSSTSVKEYGEYQLDIIQEEKQNGISGSPQQNGGSHVVNGGSVRKMLKFGTNCDLSDNIKWKRQLDEIKKLPQFLQVECPEANMLNHVGHTILGMNSVQLYMKVPGCRTPGHQENNNFCSVNINIGPGDCEWFAVDNKYWGEIDKLCDDNKLCFLTGSWWPMLDELKRKNIPVYRFTQAKGEIVWINPGTVHWVQCNSSCNNIAWNVGPLTAHQLRMAWERYQWNKVKKVRSIVPMITLTWNLAKTLKLADKHTKQQISSYLHSSYNQCDKLLKHLDSCDIPVIWHGRLAGEITPTCVQCYEEVFNILFVCRDKKGNNIVYCHKCVKQIQSKNKKATFVVLQQYTMTELCNVLSRYSTC